MWDAIERLTRFIKVAGGMFNHRLHPRHMLFIRMIGVQNNANAVMLGEQVDMLRSGYSAQHFRVKDLRHALASEELRPAIGQLNDDIRPRLAAASMTALTEFVPTTFTAGSAKPPSLQALRRVL